MNKPQPMLALVLSMAAIFVYYTFINPPAKPTVNPKEPLAVSTEKVPVATPSTPTPTSQVSSAPQPATVTSSLIPQGGSEGSFIIYQGKETDIRVNISTGTIDRVILNNYHTTTSPDSPHTDLFNEGFGGNAFSQTWGVADEALVYKLTSHKKENNSEKITLLAQNSVIAVEKTFTFGSKADPNWVDLDVIVTNIATSSQILSPRSYIVHAQKEEEKSTGFFSFLKKPADLYTVQYLMDNALKKDGMNWKKLKDKTEQPGMITWTGLTDRYFLSSLISRETSDKTSIAYGKMDNKYVYTSLSYGSYTLEPQKSLTQKFSGYFGPKKRDTLKANGVGLEKSVDYGMFGFIAIPLLYLLIQLQHFLGNWGLAIIALTFLVKMLLHPVNKKSMESMKAMQKLQPKMAEIREKYKNDREKLNVEMMQIFKTNNVNPMSGCLPLIMQMPIYFALYRVLWNAIELYHAPFFGFYKDLAAPDPYMISPVLLGIFMMLQQKLTPSAASVDPAQQKIMMIMPLMFCGFMLFLPSGLVIYIFVNTVMSVIQQYMMHKEVSGMDLLRKLLPQKN